MSHEISVVIPTWNRLDVLPEVLESLENQRDAPPFEILVVNDGSTDGTKEWLEARDFRRPTRVIHQPNAGPAAARNRGVEAAEAGRVAFLGDDTVPDAGWLAAHHAVAKRAGEAPWVASVGYTGWHPRISETPFLRWINEHGLQFGYALIEDPENVPFNFFYTSNLCVPRDALLAEPFDERFPYAAWEDIEAAYRLQKRDFRLVYVAEARTEHDHPTDLDRFMQRQEKAGYSGVVFATLHPEMGDYVGVGEGGPPGLPSSRRQQVRERLARLLQNKVVVPRLWNEVLRFHYIRGLHRGWTDRERWRKELQNEPTA